MRSNTRLALASAAIAALTAGSVFGQTLAISLGVRETNSVAPIGDPGGTAGGIEWINKDGLTLNLNDTWQTFTFNFGTDPVAAFTGNGVLDGTRGVLEHIRLLNTAGLADVYQVYFDSIVNTVGGVPTTITGFEANETPPAVVDTQHMFRLPNLSGSTSGLITATPNISRVTAAVADTGTQAYEAQWSWINTDPTNWMRYTTFNTAVKPNPTIDYSAGNSVSFRLRGVVLEPVIRWANTTAGPSNWSDPANWNGGTVPGISFVNTETGYFGSAPIAPATVNVDVPIVLNTLRLKNVNGYTFNTNDPLVNNITLTGSAAFTANINAEVGSHTINVPILLDSRALSVNVGEASAVLALNGGVNFDSLGLGGGQSLVKSGPGRVDIPQIRSFVDFPDDTPPTPPNPSRSITVNGGTIRLLPHAAAQPQKVSRTNRLGIAGATDNWTARFDMTNNALIIDYADLTLGGVDPRAAKENQIKSGYASGAWTGNGITSSTAAAAPTNTVALGIVQATDIGSPATFFGEPIDNTTVLIGFTRMGDTNLDGTTNIGDFSRLASNFNLPGRWFTGDLNYDGTTNIGDFSLLAANFNLSAPARAAVPEPTVLSLLGVAGLMGLRRRR